MNKFKVLSPIAAIAIGLIIAIFIKLNSEQQAHVIESPTLTETSSHEALKDEKLLDDLTNSVTSQTEDSPIANADGSLNTIAKDFSNADGSTDTNLENLESSDSGLIEQGDSNLIPSTDITTSESTQTTTTEKLIHMITLKTSMGDIELALDAEKAPLTVENFIKYAKNGQYNGTIFHRVIKGFMVQGGGFEPGMEQKKVDGPIPNEANNGLVNKKYSIAMARTSDPHSATAQFFINAKDNDFLNFTSESGSGWGYAVFGEVTKGQDIVDAIEGVSTGNTGGFGDVPLEDVVIESVVVAD